MSEPQDRWHLKKEIQLGHLITTVTVAVAAIIYIQKIEQRVAVIEARIEGQQASDKVLRAQLDRINDKLDRLIERGVPSR